MTATTVKVAKVGDAVQEIAVTSDMTVETLLEAAGYDGHQGRIYATNSAGQSQQVSATDNVNGYSKIVLSTDVKGGKE